LVNGDSNSSSSNNKKASSISTPHSHSHIKRNSYGGPSTKRNSKRTSKARFSITGLNFKSSSSPAAPAISSPSLKDLSLSLVCSFIYFLVYFFYFLFYFTIPSPSFFHLLVTPTTWYFSPLTHTPHHQSTMSQSNQFTHIPVVPFLACFLPPFFTPFPKSSHGPWALFPFSPADERTGARRQQRVCAVVRWKVTSHLYSYPPLLRTCT
jgi:hypothetical protein